MNTRMQRWSMWVVVVLVVGCVFGVTMTDGWSNTEAVTAAPQAKKGEAQLDLLVSIPVGVCPDGTACNSKAQVLEEIRGLRSFNVDSFFDIDYRRVYSNIGSSGQDGVRFNVDSFFDIHLFGDPDFDLFGDPDFDLFGDPDFDLMSVSVRGTLADPSNPGLVLDELDQSLQAHKHRGHVTVLK